MYTSARTAIDLLKPLAPIGARFFELAQYMSADGYRSYEPLLTFEESFCSSQEGVKKHREYRVALAEEMVGNLQPYAYLRDDAPLGFRSPTLQELRAHRATSGNAFAVHDRSKPWLIELSPCKSHQVERMLSSSPSYEALRKPFLAEWSELRIQEVRAHGNKFASGDFNNKAARLAFCRAVAREAFEGFEFVDKSSGTRTVSVRLQKPLTEGWNLRWRVDGTNIYRPTGTRPEDQLGFLDAYVELVPVKGKGRVSNNESVPVAYQNAAPLGYSEFRYDRFVAAAELEMLIRLHALVYGLVQHQLEGILRRTLTST